MSASSDILVLAVNIRRWHNLGPASERSSSRTSSGAECNPDSQLEEALALLSSDERVKAQRFVFFHDCVRSVTGALLIKLAIACANGISISDVTIGRSSENKPIWQLMLGGFVPFPSMQFNLSHHDDWVLLAVHKSRLIGTYLHAKPCRCNPEQCGSTRSYDMPRCGLIAGVDVTTLSVPGKKTAEEGPDAFIELMSGTCTAAELARIRSGVSGNVHAANCLSPPMLCCFLTTCSCPHA